MSVTHVYEKYGTSLTVQGKTSNGLQVRIAREGKPARVATWGAIPLKRDMQATLEERPPQVESNRPELVQRLLADFCDLCGSEEDVQVHHERAMRKLHEHEGRPKAQWVKRMIALRRKTVLLCSRCHEAVADGRPLTWTLLTLKEVKAPRSARMTAIPESRVH